MTLATTSNSSNKIKITEEKADSCKCSNLVCVHNTTNEKRAILLKEYIASLPVEPLLMPRTEDGKKPLVAEKEVALDSDRGRDLLVTPEEAIRQIREEGVNGFCLYAGKPSHNTEELVFADHDDMVKFPLDTLPDTLTVRSGSGEGYHETFLNSGNIENAKGKDEYSNSGEIRAKNWLVVAPGSIHPSGGIYHVSQGGKLETLHEEDLPKGLQKRTRVTTNTQSLSDSDLETVSKEIDSETVERAEQYLNEWKSDNLSAFYCLYDRLIGGRGDYGSELDNDSNHINRDLQEKTILTHLYGVYRDTGYSDTGAKELAYQLLSHYCVESNNGNTKDGRPRKWLVRSEDYKATQLRYCAVQFDRNQFERFKNKSTNKQSYYRRLNNEYSPVTRGIALFVVDLLSGVHAGKSVEEIQPQLSGCYNFTVSEEELTALFAVVKENHIYNDIPRCLGNRVLKEEPFYPKKSVVKDVCKRIDRVYKGNTESTFDEALKRLQREGIIKVACMKDGVEYRVYPSDCEDIPNVKYIKHNGEKI